MGQWEPLADRIPLDVRRLATQLRRMKDRSGLTVPALAARTAESADAWAAYLAARKVPPLAAVEVLAQASGADYDRIGALWKLAEKASAGAGDRGRGKPVPQPDPLDPLSAQDGLPARRRHLVMLAAGILAVASLLAVVLMAGTSDGRAPGRDADPTGTGATTGAPAPSAAGRGRTPASENTGVPGAGTGTSTGTPGSSGATATPAPPLAAATVPPSAGTAAAPIGAAVPTASGGTGTVAPTATATSAPAATPSPTRTGLCLGLIVLGICVG